MRKPRISTLIIGVQFVLLLVCAAFLGMALWHNYFLKYYAKKYAFEAGFAEATHNFMRGEICLYEIKIYKIGADDEGTVPDDGATEPAHKMDGQIPVNYFLVNEDFPRPHQEIQQAFVDGYNQHMRQYLDHPEWFDKNGLRIPMHELHIHRNTTNATE